MKMEGNTGAFSIWATFGSVSVSFLPLIIVVSQLWTYWVICSIGYQVKRRSRYSTQSIFYILLYSLKRSVILGRWSWLDARLQVPLSFYKNPPRGGCAGSFTNTLHPDILVIEQMATCGCLLFFRLHTTTQSCLTSLFPTGGASWAWTHSSPHSTWSWESVLSGSSWKKVLSPVGFHYSLMSYLNLH